MLIQKFTRKPFEIDAVLITDENFDEVCKWAHGRIVNFHDLDTEEHDRHIKINVHRPNDEESTKARVGDYVTKAGSRFKIYHAESFHKGFDEVLPPGDFTILMDAVAPFYVQAGIRGVKVEGEQSMEYDPARHEDILFIKMRAPR